MKLADTNTVPVKKRRKKVSETILRERPLGVSVEMDFFKEATMLAKDIERPDRNILYAVYEEIFEKDAHLRSQYRTAHFTVQQSDFDILQNGKANENLKELFSKSWFTDFISFAFESEFWGHSLIEFGEIIETEFADCELISRYNVLPEFQSFKLNITDDIESSIPYNQNMNDLYLIEIGNKRDLGLFLTACVEIIYKKNARVDWAGYNERFGMPLLSVKTDKSDETELDELEKFAANFGSNGYVIGSRETEFQIVQPTGSENGHNKFKESALLADDYISKLINGQTATSDEKSFVGSAEVQERVLNTYTKGRLQNIQRLINDRLIPFLIYHGYPLENTRFQYKDLVQKSSLQNSEEVKKKIDNVGTGHALSSLDEIYIEFKQDNNDIETLAATDKISEVFNKLSERLYELETKNKLPEPKELIKLAEARELLSQTAKFFENGIKTSFTAKFAGDTQFLDKLTKSVWVFSGFKTEKSLLEVSALLDRKDGKIMPFNMFRDSVLKLDRTYNQNYLKAEYNIAVSASLQASRWKQFEQNKDIAFLKYRTANDERVRDKHDKLHNIILPFDDEFWDEHFPPNGWGCRCLVIEVLKEDNTPTAADEVSKKTENFFNEKEKIFAYNPGKTGAIFPEKHPYYKFAKEKLKKESVEAINYEALDAWAHENFDKIKDDLKEKSKKLSGNPYNVPYINKLVTIDSSTFEKNLKKGNGLYKRYTLLNNIDVIINDLRFIGEKDVKKEDFSIKEWQVRKRFEKKYYFFESKFKNINFQIDIKEMNNGYLSFYFIKLL